MTDAMISALPKKIGKRPSGRSRSSLSPKILSDFCSELSGALTQLLDIKTAVSLESVGLEPFDEVTASLPDPMSVALVNLNGVSNASMICLDNSIVFHVVDLLLGGDANANELPAPRSPSALDDKFCRALADAAVLSFCKACDLMIGLGACVGRCSDDIEHNRANLDIAPMKSDVLAIRMAINIGQAGRTGAIEFHIPLTSVDLICGGPGETTDLEMQLDMIGVLHTESMSVADLSRLDVGTIIQLPNNAIASVPLVLEDGGDFISEGELGASSEMRTIRLCKPPDEVFLAPLFSLLPAAASEF